MAKQIITLEVEYVWKNWKDSEYPEPIDIDWETAADEYLRNREVGAITTSVRAIQYSEVRYEMHEGPDAVGPVPQ